MSAPTLTFLYNYGTSDTAYSGTGGADGNWKVIDINTCKKIYTGGGILGTLPIPTCAAGTRDATIRPITGVNNVPQIYIEDATTMYHVPLASGNPNTNRHVFAVYVDGTCTSDIYLEYWDDDTCSSTNLPVLSGTSAYPHSMVNAIRTTASAPPSGWTGASSNAEYLAGFAHRLPLKDASSVSNEAVYFNIYISIPYDSPLFHNQPVETFRYLYS